jgi:23S rRNA (uracil1939-C5)-methyltransferase
MTRNKKKNMPLLEHVTITACAAEGKALARVEDKVVFVPFVVPGDVVDLQVKKKKSAYMEAVAVSSTNILLCAQSPYAATMACAVAASGNVSSMASS